MKCPLLFAGLIAFASPVCRADFEKWTNKDGKVAEMELQEVEEQEGKVWLHFKMKGGTTIRLDLSELSDGDQLRVRAWKPGELRVKFVSYRVTQKTGDLIEAVLSFGAVRGNLATAAPVRARNPILKVGGVTIETTDCDAMFEQTFDPFSKEGSDVTKNPIMLELWIKAKMSEKDISRCDLTCDIDCLAGMDRKQVRGFIMPPKEKVGERQQFGPLSVRMVRSYGSVGENDEEGELSGYYTWIDRDPDKDGDQDESLISRTFVVNGKEVGDHLEPEQAGGRVSLKIDYWDRTKPSTFRLTKSAAEAGVEVADVDPFEDSREKKPNKKR